MYEIKVLSSKDFDNLPLEITKGSDISDSLGFSDPTTGKAYVRYTAHEELNKYLIDHEFEELTTNKHAHEDSNGLRHKKFSNFLRNFYDPTQMFHGASWGTGGNRNSQFQGADDSGDEGFYNQGETPFTAYGYGDRFNPAQSNFFNRGTGQKGYEDLLSQFGSQQGLPPELLERLRGSIQGGRTFQF